MSVVDALFNNGKNRANLMTVATSPSDHTNSDRPFKSDIDDTGSFAHALTKGCETKRCRVAHRGLEKTADRVRSVGAQHHNHPVDITC